MTILVIGGGGREHALVWKLSQSKNVEKIYCAPGNAGIAQIAECVDIEATDIAALVRFAKQKEIGLTVVGPETSLVMGVVDEFEKAGLAIFGPRKNAAIIEGSKAFSKEFMKKHGIPTAQYETFDNYENALAYVEKNAFPAVVKADGLAAGKGVIICQNFEEAKSALSQMFLDKSFGESGGKVVIEQYLTGTEISVLAFCDGKTIVPMESAQDHKKVFDGELGPNTGGMGTFSPSGIYSDSVKRECIEKIFLPTVNALNKEGIEFKGVIFFGLMLTGDGVKVIEYNARFGDPETQSVLPRLKTDLVEIFHACINGTLDGVSIEWYDDAAACVVLTSGGYPGKYTTGYVINGLCTENGGGVYVFHAATNKSDGRFITSGGRVLGVTAMGENVSQAAKVAYKAVSGISFKDMHYRRDIGTSV